MCDVSGSTRNKSILHMEQRLTYLTENDPQNEEIYHLLKKLAYIYINQNKYTYGYNGIEDVCHDVAADVWMAVLGGKKINAWIYYIGKMIKLSYVTKQKNLEHEIIYTDNDPILKENIKRMCASSSISCINEFDNMQRNLMLDGIINMIDDVMEHCKYKKGTKEYLQLKTNVCINLVKTIDNQKPIKFRISDSVDNYVDITMDAFKKYFKECGFAESIMDGIEDDLEMQLKVDENYVRFGGKK